MSSPRALADAPSPDVHVGRSSIAGSGLFTSRAWSEGERIAVIDGEIVSGDEAEARDALGNVYIYELDEDTYVDAAAGIGRWVNHSCRPSCRIEGRNERSLWLVAARDLAEGDELTIDYDYPEIFEACRRLSSACEGDACPRARDATENGATEGLSAREEP